MANKRYAYLTQVYKDLIVGTPITDSQLATAIRDFQQALDILKALGPVFRLPAMELQAKLDAMEYMQTARTKKSKA